MLLDHSLTELTSYHNSVIPFHSQDSISLLGVKWYDKITNTAVKKTTGLTDLLSLVTD